MYFFTSNNDKMLFQVMKLSVHTVLWDFIDFRLNLYVVLNFVLF